jgi:hypothetical protein
MTSAVTAQPRQPCVLTPTQIVALLDVWAAADQALAVEIDRLICTRNPVSRTTLSRWQRLLDEVLRPAVNARATLAELPRELLGQGLALRQARRLTDAADRAAS